MLVVARCDRNPEKKRGKRKTNWTFAKGEKRTNKSQTKVFVF